VVHAATATASVLQLINPAKILHVVMRDDNATPDSAFAKGIAKIVDITLTAIDNEKVIGFAVIQFVRKNSGVLIAVF
jgi:hypothetical protein